MTSKEGRSSQKRFDQFLFARDHASSIGRFSIPSDNYYSNILEGVSSGWGGASAMRGKAVIDVDGEKIPLGYSIPLYNPLSWNGGGSTSQFLGVEPITTKSAPGDLMGTQQSGILNLKIADIVKDNDILKLARSYAFKILKEDPNLATEENRIINYTYQLLGKHKNIWNYIS